MFVASIGPNKTNVEWCNMDLKELESIAEGALDHAKTLLVSKGNVMPVAFLFCPSSGGEIRWDVQVLPMPFTDDQEKSFYREILKRLSIQFEAVAVIMVMEAWFATRPIGSEIPDAVRDLPDRQEALMVSGRTAESSLMLMQPFRREGEKIVFEKQTVMNAPPEYDRFTDGIFPPPPHMVH